MKKRMLSLLLALCMVLSCVPMSALAAEGDACTGTVNCTGTYDANGLCNVCGLAKPCAHTGGSATCKEQAVCENCGMPYGELAAHNYGTDADGMCDECGAECVHSYTDGLCICGVTEPEQEPVVLTISAWRWDDEAEIISADGTYATLPNAADWETLKTVLPQSITATVDGEEVTVPVTWECETFPAEGEAQGTYKLKAILPEGYTLGEDVAVLELEVELGVAEQYAVTASKPSVGDGSEANPYQITTAGELKWFQASASKSACAKLMNDITYNENVIVNGALTSDTSNLNKWTSIGTSNSPYTGTFDGNGNAVIGLYLDNVSSNYQGMFGCANGATIKNLTVKDSYINASAGVAYGLYVGAIVGGTKQNGSGVTITNCHNSGSIIRGGGSVGGIFGYSDRTAATITNCTNSGTITGLITSGGSETGGIVGNLWYGSASVSGCSNSGTIISGCGNAGGIVGSMSSTTGTMSGCTNTGTVRYMEGTSDRAGALGGVAGRNTLAMTDCHNQGQVIGYRGMGGIAGYNSSNGSMTNCTNSGNVTAESPTEGHAGGVVYSNSATITNCSNSGAITGWRFLGGLACYNNGTISNCNNSGTVTASSNSTSTPATSGGLLAATKSKNGTIENSYNSGAVKGNNRVGGVAGKIEHACTFTNCYNVGEVTGTGTSSKDIGGVFGYYDASVTISNCYNEAAVSGYENVGGVAGWVNSALTNCHNSGNVNGTKYVGGVVGYVSNGSTFVVSKCYNTASVSGTSCVGGVAGYIRRAVENCYNTGAVSGTSSVGGVVGSQISANYVKYSYNIGDVTATSSFGGVVPSSAVTSCYYLDTCVTGGATVTGAAALTAEQMTDDTNWKTNYSGFDSTTPVWTKLNNVGTKGHLPRLDAIDEPYLTIEPAHEHSWTYEASDANGDSVNDTITATCTAAECTLTDSNGGTVSIAAPDSLVYTGSAIEAKVENTLVDTTTEVVVVYQKDGGTLSDKPSAPGTYTASITLGEAAVSVEYTIYTTITFDANGGAWEDGDVTKTVKGSEITTPAAPAKTGYSFDGWDREIPTTMPEENITIKAKWTVNQYTITFANTGDSTIAPITQDFGTTVTAPADPTWTGHSFQEWYDENGQIYDFATPVTGDITLTAKWVLSTHRINVVSSLEGVTAKSDPEFVDYGQAAEATISVYPNYAATHKIVSIGKVFRSAEDITGQCTINGATVTFPSGVITADIIVNATVAPKNFVASLTVNGVVTNYTTLDGAISAAELCTKEDEAVVTLLDDIDLGSNPQQIDSGVFTIDLNGKNLSNQGTWGGVLYILGGTITIDGQTGGSISGTASGIYINGSSVDLTVTGGEISSENKDGISNHGGKVTINGGTISTKKECGLFNGGTAIITGGTIDSEGRFGVAVQDGGKLTVTGGSISGPEYDLYFSSGSISLALPEGGTTGATFPGGIKVQNITLNEILDEDAAYGQNGSIVKPAADAKEIAGGDVIVAASYTVTWTGTDGVTTQFLYGETLKYEGELPKKPGFVVEGWKYYDTSYAEYTGTTMPAFNLYAYPNWVSSEETYTVSYYADETLIKTENVRYEGFLTPPAQDEIAQKMDIPDGYILEGWVDENGDPMPGKLLAEEDQSYYAKWECTHEATKAVPNDDGKTHSIVCTNPECGETIGDPVMHDYTYDAENHKCVCGAVETYTITWKNIDGQEVYFETVEYGALPQFNDYQTPTYPAGMMEEGYEYTWTGWSDTMGGEKLERIPAVTGDEDYYAFFETTAKQYSVVWYVDDTFYNETYVGYGEAITAPEVTGKEGYTFAWADIPETMPAKSITINGGWTVNKYDITWIVDGTETVTEDVAYGTVIERPEAPTKEGHTFTGWEGYTEGMTMPDEAVTFTAQWEAKTYTVTWTVDGETYTTTEATYGEAITQPETDPEKVGHSFTCWIDVPETMPDDEALTIAASFAANTYTVDWFANGGYIFFQGNDRTITNPAYGAVITAPANVRRTGYTLTGWNTAADGSGKALTAETTMDVAENGKVVYYAQWDANQYTITFDTDGGTEIAPITQDYGTAVIAPADPTKEGYTFASWDKEIPATMPAENVTITATWTVNAYTITFDTDGGTEIAPITQDYGTAVTAPAEPTKEGYTFAGWDKEIPATMPAGDVTIKANWTVNAYTITFDTDGGTEIEPITQAYGTAVTAPADPTKEGYTFAGWDKEIPATMPAENVTITATWTVNAYTITFDTDGGTEIAPITQDYGTAVIAPAEPTKEGYTFAGWDKEIPATMPAGDVTIKVNWTVNAYTITFDTDGGTEIEPITQAYGTAVTAPADPTKEGYTFAGWDKEIPATMPAENVTITATWTVNEYTITFDTDGGTEIAPITQDYGTAVTAPADPAKEGYTFARWDKEIPATMPAENMTITAQWTVNSYKVTFAVNGEDYKEVVFAYGEKVVAPAYEIPAGHTFSGWTVPETMPAEDITLDATLTINQYTITWKDDQDNTLYTEDLYYGTMPAFDAEQSDKELSKACHILSWSPEIVEVTENATYTAVWTLDHSGETEVRDAREATCTEDGYTGDTYCLGCGEKLEDGETITAPGHSHGTEWESDEKQHWHECECGDKADIADHTGGEATCKEPAQCEICGEAYGETDPENHTGETEIRDAKEATDTEDGYTGDTYCLDCGALLQKGEVIPATKPSVPSTPVKPLWKIWLEKWHEKWNDGCDKVECDHEYTDEVVEPTCCQKGYTVHTCDKCGFKYCDTYTEALGHAWDEGEVTREASCTENGEKTYTCEVCGETRTEVICATGHDFEDGTCTHCGEAEKPCKPIIWPFFWRWLWKAK